MTWASFEKIDRDTEGPDDRRLRAIATSGHGQRPHLRVLRPRRSSAPTVPFPKVARQTIEGRREGACLACSPTTRLCGRRPRPSSAFIVSTVARCDVVLRRSVTSPGFLRVGLPAWGDGRASASGSATQGIQRFGPRSPSNLLRAATGLARMSRPCVREGSPDPHEARSPAGTTVGTSCSPVTPPASSRLPQARGSITRCSAGRYAARGRPGISWKPSASAGPQARARKLFMKLARQASSGCSESCSTSGTASDKRRERLRQHM